MGLMDKYAGSAADRGRIGEGTFPARIAQIIDLGRQHDEYQGEKSIKNKLWITFEFPTETIKIEGVDKPRWLSCEFTRSTNEKAKLYSVIKAANINAGSFTDLLGMPLLVGVGTTSGGKDKYTSAMPLPKGMEVAPLANAPVWFDMECPDQSLLEKFPNFLQEKIENSLDWKGATAF